MEIFNILFLVFILLTFVRQTNDDAFSLRSMNVMKGIAIVGVFVGHTSKEFLGFALYKLFCYIGLFSVSVFFFVSGYGLMYGMLNKKAYHKGFIKKRILPIGICYILTCLLQWTTDGFSGLSFSKILLCEYTPFAWYIFSIVWLYIIFYIAMLIGKNPINVVLTTAILLGIYTCICLFLLGQNKGAVAMITFLIGNTVAYQNKRNTLGGGGSILTILLFVFILLYGIQLTNKYVHYPNILTAAYEPVVSYIFPFLVLGFMQRFSIKRFDMIWIFFQKHSLQIYLTHGIVMYKIIEWGKLPTELSVFVIFGITIVLAIIMYRMTNFIIRIVNQ